MVITYGEMVTCAVTPVGDIDIFQFQGTAGEAVLAIAVSTGTTPSTSPEFCLALYGPSGSVVINYQCAFPTATFGATLATTGTYTIQVVTANFTGTGPYTLSLQRVSSPPSPTAKPIGFQSIVDDQINLVGEDDLYTFTAVAGAAVQATIVALGNTPSTAPEFCLALYGPSGGVLVNFQCAFPSASFSATLASAGTYTISVVTADFTGTGPYALNLACHVANCGPPPPVNPLQFVPVTPCRVMDTRNPNGPLGGPFLPGGGARSVPVPGSCGIPSTANAYSLNLTALPRTNSLGYLTVWPAGQAQPLVSTLNSVDGSVLSNAAIVPAGTNGAINVFASFPTDVLFDINGYFAQ
jgi:hypothetical protein